MGPSNHCPQVYIGIQFHNKHFSSSCFVKKITDTPLINEILRFRSSDQHHENSPTEGQQNLQRQLRLVLI